MVTVSCWERVWSAAEQRQARAYRAMRGEYARIDREVEALKDSLTSDRRLSADALSTLLGMNVSGPVEARIAVDGHDVEVRLEDGLWRVLNPQTFTLGDEHILALNASTIRHTDSRDVIAQLLTTSNPTDRLLRIGIRKNA